MSAVLRDDAVKTPGFPESVAQGDLKWLKKVGDTVRMDEVVAEIETDKVSAQPCSATVRSKSHFHFNCR